MKKKDILSPVLIFIALIAVAAVLAVKYRTHIPTLDETVNTITQSVSETTQQKKTKDLEQLASSLSALSGKTVTASLLANLDSKEIEAMEEAAENNTYSDELWYDTTGYTLNALIDKYELKRCKNLGNNGKSSFTIGFTGDINFTQTGYVMTHANYMPNGVLDCIDETFQSEMRSADIMLVNNEFPYSDRGSPTPDKKYTFRAKPETVKYMTALGVDIVSLSNNHAYDYGYESFVDTIATLDEEGITHIGAGMNIEEASKYEGFIINGKKVGFLACCGVESPIKTPVATQDSEGIMGSYDNGELMCEKIREAKEECDYVIVYPHWGIENTTQLTNAQQVNSRKWIDAGADAVIGAHPHVLQGMEFYNGVPIIYSLGNFWFNTRNIYTGLLKLIISDDAVQPVFVPGRQSGSETHYLDSADERRSLYDTLEGYMPYNKVVIDDEGYIKAAEPEE